MILLTGCIMTTTLFTSPAATIQIQAQTNYVYIAASGNGKKYHDNKNCSRMRGRVKKLKISQAKKQGYGPCKKCYR